MTTEDPQGVPNQEETAAPQPTPPRGLWKPVIFGLIFLGLGLWLVLALLPGFLSREGTVAPEEKVAETSSVRRIRATLFYVSPDGAELVPVVREVAYGATPAEQAKRIVEAQLAPPTEGQVSAIPGGTSVRSVFLGTRGEAYVDLSPEVSQAARGTIDEALAVFAIVNAITSNLPGVDAVQILVNGKEVDTLAGHLDLRQPIGRANNWVRKGQ